MDNELGGCPPAAGILGVSADSVECDECPFPFCVAAEAGIIRRELREHLVRIMHKLGNSMEKIAETMEVSLRSTYRYASAHAAVNCVQCNIIHSLNVMCKSDTYSVVRKGGQYIVVLNKHRHATRQELKRVKCFIDYAFPSSTVEKNADSHDYWVLGRVDLEEAKNFGRMCDALNTYTLGLSKGAECLQQTR